MSEGESPAGPAAAEPVIERGGRRLSVVWLIPIVAAVVGAVVAWRAISEHGPQIEIRFATAEGIEAGTTKVKFKQVEVGLVEEVVLAEDLSGVVVRARMVNDAERWLREGTRFWVETARVAGGQVSGLGTLLSGAYIGVDPVLEGEEAHRFVALETPPVVSAGQAGRHFTLRSYRAGALPVGTPVFFRHLEVGRVVSSVLDESGDFVEIGIFVDAPHDRRVQRDARFWNASGLDVSVTASGVQVDTESVVSLLVGGIAFDTPPRSDAPPAEADASFVLHETRQAAEDAVYGEKQYYLVRFTQSVRGLVVGSPVEFLGIPIGRVTEIRLVIDHERKTFEVPVVIEIEPGRIADRQVPGSISEWHANLDQVVAQGLRAQLRSGNLLTGQLVVALDMHERAEAAQIDWSGPLPEIPTVPAPLEELTSSAMRIAQKIERLPLDEIARDVRGALEALRGTLAQTDRTLASTQGLISPGSPVIGELQRTLVELREASRSLGLAADQLQQEPESLIFGREDGP